LNYTVAYNLTQSVKGADC